MSKSFVACGRERKPSLVWLLAAVAVGACDAEDKPSVSPDVDGGVDVAARDARADLPATDGAVSLDALNMAPDVPPQDLTPVMINRPVIVRKGTRLRGFFVQSAEGAQERWLLWDSQLSARCSVLTADDGKARCLPPAPSNWALDYETGYIDAGCSEPALPEAPACAAAFGFKYLPAGRATYKLGPAVELTSLYQNVVVNNVLKCEARPLPAPRRYFTLGEKIPATSFVERLSNPTDGPQTQRIKYVYDEMADGTRVLSTTFSVWDADLETFCRAARADDGWLRCLPSAPMTASTVTFTDAACTRTAGFSTREPPEKYAVQVDGEGCQATRRVFKVGMKVPTDQVYRILNERCTKTTGTGYFFLSEELPPARFAAFRPAVVGSGRLQERYFVGEEGVAHREITVLWDTQLGQPCTFDATAAGRRCVPLSWAGYHADETCGARAARGPTAVCGAPGPNPAPPMITVAAAPWCAPQAVPTGLGATLMDPTRAFTRNLSTGMCNAVTFASGGAEFRRFADPLSLEMFVPGTEGMD